MADTRDITFHGRTIGVLEPSTEQLALLAQAQQWWRRNQRGVAELGTKFSTAAGDEQVPDDARKLAERGTSHIARLQTVIGAMFADPEDWEWVQDGMAMREIPWQDITDLPHLIQVAFRDEPEAGNREERRTQAKRGRRAV